MLIKFYSFTNIYDLKFLDSETTGFWFFFFFFEICTEERFASYVLSNEGSIKTSILLIILECIAVGCSNGNESFTGRLFLNYGRLNVLFHFFRNLIYNVFSRHFCQKVYEETILKLKKLNYSFSQISKIHLKV